ncbi:Clp protease N-terminal domain-containing protein [Algisphaera agarilytica]|uniref:ATP-dependent Clp protease ATP-binding subunit ClpA n=1 Tax=Algisphaera agarilytica TaxID=1385975 RepID=A0A7X0H5C1_9BACT|nr:Clp protease N-terminal domain-containing protein [Algisphaera agarilytica]MBB6429337.1 ATP-dependent Clp protease ATP-binding subunit ClpA [Algisphaera agarilytica]
MSQKIASYDRFSDDLRDAMRIANRFAKAMRSREIETPHLLYALIKEPTGLAGHLLRCQGLSAKEIKRSVTRPDASQRQFTIFGKLPLSQNGWGYINDAIDHAIGERHDSVGTAGLLRVMILQAPQVIDILTNLNVPLSDFEKDVAKYLHRHMVENPGEPLYFDS